MVIVSYPAPRVAQLDGHILDTELTSLLKEQVTSIFKLHATNRFSYTHHSEFYDLILKLVVFQLTVMKKSASYGLSLQNLKLSNTSNGKKITFNKRLALFLLIIAEYLYKKLQSYLYSIDDENLHTCHTSNPIKKLKNLLIKYRIKILTYLDNILKVLSLSNFILFLIDGRHANLIYRVLLISLTPIVPDLLKFNGNNVNYEFQNRQLVWNVMTEFLVFTLPLLQLNKLRSFASKIIPLKKKLNNNKSKYANLPLSKCAICHDINQKALSMGQKTFESSATITNPYITNCGHVFCYVCLAGKFNYMSVSGEPLKCPRCLKKLIWFEEYGINGNSVDTDAILFTNDDSDDEDEIEKLIEDIEDEKVYVENIVEDEKVYVDENEDDDNDEDEQDDVEYFDDDDEEFDDDDDGDDMFEESTDL